MTRYELLKASESILRTCDLAGIQPSEVRYLQVYEEWVRLVGEGQKKTWVLAILGETYNISEATIKRIVKKMAKKVRP